MNKPQFRISTYDFVNCLTNLTLGIYYLYMNTQDVTKVQMRKVSPTEGIGRGLSWFVTNWNFYYKNGGTKYYIDKIDTNMGCFTIRNSKTGQSKIVILNSDLLGGRYSDTFFFSPN